MTFSWLYTSGATYARQKEIAETILDEVCSWANPAAHEMFIEHMKWFAEEYKHSADLAIISAYTLCVCRSSDEGEKKPCPSVTTESLETATVEKSTSEKPDTGTTSISRRVHSLGGYFGLAIWRLVGFSANWSSRFGRWASRGARLKKPSGNWRTANGRASMRRS